MSHAPPGVKHQILQASFLIYIYIYRYITHFCCFTLHCVTSSLSALAADERNRPLPMKVHSCRPSASHDPQTDLKTKREVRTPPSPCATFLHVPFEKVAPYIFATQMYAEQRRSSDNMSARSSDSDHSNMSALSRASSASRLSSTSYMSIQSERPGGRLRSVHVSCLSNRNCQYDCTHANHCVSVCFFLFVSACQPLRISVLLHAQSGLRAHTHQRAKWGL